MKNVETDQQRDFLNPGKGHKKVENSVVHSFFSENIEREDSVVASSKGSRLQDIFLTSFFQCSRHFIVFLRAKSEHLVFWKQFTVFVFCFMGVKIQTMKNVTKITAMCTTPFSH